MFHPEVWSFPPPVNTSASFTSLAEEDRIPNLIKSHHFNHFVSVAIPDTLNVPEILSKSLVTDCEYYKVLSLPASEFINIDFLHNFVNKGQLSALSINSRIDVDDCICLTPSKKLILVLNKVAFQELGLDGKVADSAKRSNDRFYVTIDLSDGSLKPGSKLYTRVQKCLSQRLDLKLDFIIAWDPPEASMCPSSVAAYFDSKKYVVKLCHPKFSKQHAYNLTIPSLHSNDPADVVDWLGAASHSAWSIEQGSFLSEYLNIFKGDPCGQLAVLKWYGFFTTKKVQQLFDILRSYVKKSENISWCSLHVQGFDDSPVTFSDREHSFFINGDNSYTIFIERNQSCLVSTLNSSSKLHNKKK